VLRFVEAVVGCLQQLFGAAFTVRAEAGDAEAARGQAVDAALVGDAQLADQGAHALGDCLGATTVGAWQDGGKLLAAVAGDAVLDPEQRFGQGAGDGLQTLVTGLVAVGVVELLEEVDVADARG
jgi:hypothetical protein